MVRRPPRSTLDRSSAASDVYKRQVRDFEAAASEENVLERTTLDKVEHAQEVIEQIMYCLLYTSPSPRDRTRSRMPSSA